LGLIQPGVSVSAPVPFFRLLCGFAAQAGEEIARVPASCIAIAAREYFRRV